ncbi:MAG: class I SAM-dependent methyltransferase [Nocardioidaceae bacterium]
MQITGERTVPDLPAENYWFRRHEAAYRRLAPRVAGRRVLEAGCGEGYGAALLAGSAAAVTAVDYDAYTVEHVRSVYPDLPVVQGNLVALPFEDGAYDIVVSLQTVEHLWDQPLFARECLRVLAPGGQVVLTTPNRLTFPPGNVFHTHELDAVELHDLLADAATLTELRGLHHGPRLRVWEERHGDLVEAQVAAEAEAWSDDLTQLVASVTVDDFEVRDDDLAGCLDLWAVAVRA